MASKSKQRPEQHLIDSEAQDLIRSVIPRDWVLRDYRPDYGIDYDVEVFKGTRTSEGVETSQNLETLGEHFFIQLKGFKKIARRTVKLYGRLNVEKSSLQEDKDDLVGEMEVIPYSLEMSEIVTVQRMGAALPVLLVLADLDTKNCYFVCLNDYIEKILIPKYKNYTSTNTRVIHVPTKNLLAPIREHMAMRWYAKRAKLYAAFQKFVYQKTELEYAYETSNFLDLAHYFASLLIQYDFWQDTEMWKDISDYGKTIEGFLETGIIETMKILGEDVKIKEYLQRQNVLVFWRQLANLSQIYEEICREWFLPTSLGFLSSY